MLTELLYAMFCISLGPSMWGGEKVWLDLHLLINEELSKAAKVPWRRNWASLAVSLHRVEHSAPLSECLQDCFQGRTVLKFATGTPGYGGKPANTQQAGKWCPRGCLAIHNTLNPQMKTGGHDVSGPHSKQGQNREAYASLLKSWFQVRPDTHS